MKTKFRCDCPITTAIDIIGDKWVLVIVKQMLVEGKQTFKDFMNGQESIATNILSNKLALLLEYGILNKYKRPENKKSVYYYLTEKGLALTPILVEILVWSDANLRDDHPSMWSSEELELLRNDKAAFIHTLIENYREKRANLSTPA